MNHRSDNGINFILKRNMFSFTQHFDLIKVTISICFARCFDGSLHMFHKPGNLLSHGTKTKHCFILNITNRQAL